MLVETFAFLNSKDTPGGLTFSTTSQYALLKELLERVWEAIEQLHDSSFFFYKGGHQGVPVVLQRMCFTEDALIFRFLGSLLKRLDDVYTGRYDAGISVLSVNQGNCATCLFTGDETSILNCATYHVASLPTIKSLIGYAHHVYSAEAFNSTIIIRLTVILPTRTNYIYLVEPPGHFESTHYFDSVAALSDLGVSNFNSDVNWQPKNKEIIRWCNMQDYFTQIVATTIPTFCYIDCTLNKETDPNGSIVDGLDPEVQLLTESNCEDGTITQLSWISGIHHRPINIPRTKFSMHSPKTILQTNIWRQIDGKLPNEALLDLHLYNAYIELDLDIGSKCASRSESPVHISHCQDSSRDADASPTLPVAIHVLRSLQVPEQSNKNDQLSVSAILEHNDASTPSATLLSGPLGDSSNSCLSRRNSDRLRPESNLSSEYLETTRNFIVTGEELKKMRQETKYLAERLVTMERSNTQQKLALVSNAVSFWEQFLSLTSIISATKGSSEDSRDVSYTLHGRSRSNETVTHSMHRRLCDSSRSSHRAKSVICRGEEEAKDSLTDSLPPAIFPLIQAIKHELDIYQQLVKVYHALNKRICSDVLYNKIDLDCPDKIVARFLTEETERHKRHSTLAAKKISSIIEAPSSGRKLEALFPKDMTPPSACDNSPQPTSFTEIQSALAELRNYVSTSMKKVFRDAECVQKSFLLQNEVKVCLYANKKIKCALDQLRKHFENGHSNPRTQSARASRRSSSSFPSHPEFNWRIHASIRTPLAKLMDTLTDVDALTLDITSIASSLSACKKATAALKESVQRLTTNS